MKKLWLSGLMVLMVLSLLVTGCGGGGSSDTGDPAEIALIHALLDNYAAAAKAENADGVVACFTDPFTLNGTAMTHDIFKKTLEGLFNAIQYNDYQVINRRITVSDSNNATATLQEYFVISGFPSSQTTPVETFTFTKATGNWLISAVSAPMPSAKGNNLTIFK